LIDETNNGFPSARVVAVDIPSGLASDSAETPWPHVRADATVTFTAPQPAHVLEPNASAAGELVIAPIGTPAELCVSQLALAGVADFVHLFAPRPATSHKGDFGHVLVIGGAKGKTGAATMTGLAALRAGAGLVTVCSGEPPPVVELMWAPLGDFDAIRRAAAGKTLLAIGPGLGMETGIQQSVARIVEETGLPAVLDADALTALAGHRVPGGKLVLTPHPGEMSRLVGKSTDEVQQNRIGAARDFAAHHRVTVVLKGRNTLTAFPDGEVWINPTGGPAMATGGSGDILTGLIAGLMAQFPDHARMAIVGAVWLHGRAGELAARELGEKCVIATDLLAYLPRAMQIDPAKTGDILLNRPRQGL
jgi:NAD(P)H-hydrate epimerase